MKQPEKSPFRSLSSRLFIRIFSVYLVVASVLTAFQMADVYLRHKENFIQKLDSYGLLYENSVGSAVWHSNDQKLVLAANELLKKPIITGVKIKEIRHGNILLEEGWVIDEYGNSRTTNSDANMVFLSSLFFNKIIEIPKTIYYQPQGQAVAVLMIYSNEALVLSGVKYSLLIILGSAILKMFVLWCLFTVIVGRYLVRPLQDIIGSLEAVNPLSIRVSESIDEKKKECDEIRELQIALDTLLLKLHTENMHLQTTNGQVNEEISAQHQSLEKIRILNEALENRILECSEGLMNANDFTTQLIESIPNPMFYKQANGQYHRVNEAFKSEFDIQVTGEDSVKGLIDSSFLSEKSVIEEEVQDTSVISSQKAHSYETTLKDHQGNLHELLITKAPMINSRTDGLGIIGMMVNIHKQKVMENEIRTLATIDALTGCYNRRYFFEQAQKEASRGIRHGYLQAVLCLDIDNFKQINDRYGHHVGDRVLAQFADVCQAVFREGDILGRLDGEAFCVLLPHTSIDVACTVAERLRVAIAEMEVDAREAINITVSIGVSALGSSIDLEQSILLAEKALSRAKLMGRNRVECMQESDS